MNSWPSAFCWGASSSPPRGAKLRHVRVNDIGAEAAYASDAALFAVHTCDDAIFVNQLGAVDVYGDCSKGRAVSCCL